ncbi:hypothetical protein A9R04_06050 [Nocardiopsis dassonvillei]|nr:hypothetical protein A9R04_06050 [Nocardiopsis dassonvillei]
MEELNPAPVGPSHVKSPPTPEVSTLMISGVSWLGGSSKVSWESEFSSSAVRLRTFCSPGVRLTCRSAPSGMASGSIGSPLGVVSVAVVEQSANPDD